MLYLIWNNVVLYNLKKEVEMKEKTMYNVTYVIDGVMITDDEPFDSIEKANDHCKYLETFDDVRQAHPVPML